MNTDKWMPEAGQECEYTCGENWRNCEFVGKRQSGSIVLVNEHEDYMQYHPEQVTFRPIQTEADKYRDGQIEAIKAYIGWIQDDEVTGQKEMAEQCYEHGCRILSPDERIVKPLNSEQIDCIVNDNSHATADGWRIDGYAIAKAVQRELGVID